MTPAGDQVSRRGALTGGYQDARKSRMEAWRRVDEQKKKLEAGEAEKHDIASKVQDILSLQVNHMLERRLHHTGLLFHHQTPIRCMGRCLMYGN